MSKTLSGLESFYMAGQWVEPGGGVMQIICKRDRRTFVTTTP
jgi:hypothetical protein